MGAKFYFSKGPFTDCFSNYVVPDGLALLFLWFLAHCIFSWSLDSSELSIRYLSSKGLRDINAAFIDEVALVDAITYSRVLISVSLPCS